jgi:hypothetical protein
MLRQDYLAPLISAILDMDSHPPAADDIMVYSIVQI